MRIRVMAALLAAAVAGACSDSIRPPTKPESIVVPVVFDSAKHEGSPHNHRTHMSGESFGYKVIAANIENVTQAHIHCGTAGLNGPIVVWLHPSPTATDALPGGGGRHDGVLA